MDKSTFGGIILAIAGILAGLILEGGKLAQIIQPTAAMIVFGGTIGAVMIQFPLPIVFGAAKGLIHVFFNRGGIPKNDSGTRRIRHPRPQRRHGLARWTWPRLKIHF